MGAAFTADPAIGRPSHPGRQPCRHRVRARTPERPGEVRRAAGGLQASGETSVLEPASTRDHTERALAAFGATVGVNAGRLITLKGGHD
jgi:hypothetical protein